MAIFDGADGTRLTYHQAGEGRPLICVPGGPMQASAYLGDLGGLSAHRWLVLLDLRGTGASAIPADPATYRCDRQVDDVEALRMHLGLDRIDLLGHSAGGALALLYAARHPDRVGRLVLLNPSPRVVGLEITDLDRRRVAELRRGKPGSRTPSPPWSGSGRARPRPLTGRRSPPSPTADGTPSARPTWPARRARPKRTRRPSTTRPAPWTRRPPAPPWPALGHRSCWSRASTTSRSPPRVPPSMPACSVRASWPCSRAAATIPGWMIRSGWCRPWRGSWADRSAPSAQVPEADDRAGQADHGLVGIGAALVAGAEPSEAMTPGEGASQKANALPRLVVKSPRRRTTRLPNTDEQRLLQLPSGVPVTRNIRTAYAGEQPVEVLDTISNGEVVSYRFEIKV